MDTEPADHRFSGVSFGIPSALIETMGVILGLYGAGASKTIIVAGIVVAVVADALADSVSLYISAEARRERGAWKAGSWLFFTQLGFALTFVAPILALPGALAIVADVIWGLTALSLLSLHIARLRHDRPLRLLMKNLGLVLLVIAVCHYVGTLVGGLV